MLVGIMDVQVKVDSKGRISLPPELREEVGDIVIVKKTREGILLQRSQKRDFLEEFRKIITSEPPRTGKPENWSPRKMKEIWGS
jgi:bifunctional DNA-binding transcriptional regulator/antitoxin component of YhaV-PrlF toxin-antitoxin module